MKEIVLEVKDLKTHFRTRKGLVKAVDGVSFKVHKGETFALVGESGCGKSVTCMTIMGLIGRKKNEIVSGDILFKERNITNISKEERRKLRGKNMSIIFQDPMTSLNPVYTVGSQIAEMPIIHEGKSQSKAKKIAVDMLRKVGIPSPEKRVNEYPHQFSGGMRQRGVIGMSLACNPELLIADEPTTALDVTIQAQILELLRKLKEDSKSAIIMITHDLGVVAEVSDSVGVMYAGTLVEKAPVKDLFKNPMHPYTKGLLKSIPKPGSKERLTIIEGQPPDLHNAPKGCKFYPRCSYAMEKCKEEMPQLIEIEKNHKAACWLNEVNENGK
ncbi:MAG: ABC transporter ATP-binding protein [Eubacteriales bacterium]